MGGGSPGYQHRPVASHHEPAMRHNYQTGSVSSTPEVVARRDVMEKRPGYGVSPERQQQQQRGMPQTSKSMDEITVKRPTIDWNKRRDQPEEMASPTSPPGHRYSLSTPEVPGPRAVKLNQRAAGPRPDDYWMRDSNSSSRVSVRNLDIFFYSIRLLQVTPDFFDFFYWTNHIRVSPGLPVI